VKTAKQSQVSLDGLLTKRNAAFKPY
jgi:hypothetical protein